MTKSDSASNEPGAIFKLPFFNLHIIVRTIYRFVLITSIVVSMPVIIYYIQNSKPLVLNWDGTLYLQMATQLYSCHTLMFPPQWGIHSGLILQPLYPILIAVFSVFTHDVHLSAHWLIYIILGSLPLTIAFWIWPICRSLLIILIAGLTCSLFLASFYLPLILTEIPFTWLMIVSFIFFQKYITATTRQIQFVMFLFSAFFALMTMFCRIAGLGLIITFFVITFLYSRISETFQKNKYMMLWTLTLITGCIIIMSYNHYMERMGGIPEHVFLQAYSRNALGDPVVNGWRPFNWDPKTFRVSIKDEYGSYLKFIYNNPKIYVASIFLNAKNMILSGCFLLFLFHLKRIGSYYYSNDKLEDKYLSIIPDLCLVFVFIFNSLILWAGCVHYVLVPRYYHPWIACSLCILIVEIFSLVNGSSLNRNDIKMGSVFLCLILILQFPYIKKYFNENYEINIKNGGVVDAVFLKKVRDVVPKCQIILSPPGYGSNTAIAMSGRLNMHFLGSEDTYLAQANANKIKYIMVPSYVATNWDDLFKGYRRVISEAYQILYVKCD